MKVPESTAKVPSAHGGDLARFLPAEVRGYRPAEEDERFDFHTLFRLIDGGAEVYRALNVRAVVSRRYARDGAPDLMADIFDMGSSADAFGAYRNDMREGADAGVGQESEAEGSALYFWKDRFFVSVVALGDDAETRRAVLAVGKAIAGAIPREGPKPAILDLLPREGLVTSQVHYFHDHPTLNRRYPLSEANLLGLDGETEGLLARYRGSVVLVLVGYPEAARAEGAHRRFAAEHRADGEGLFKDAKGWAAVRLLGDIWIGVFGAPGRAEAKALADQVGKKTAAGSNP